MKLGVLLLIFSTLGIFAKDVTKIHDWVQKNIQSLEKYIQETDMTSDILLGVQRNDKGINFQNWILSTNHKQHIELTDGLIKKTTAFGPESEYFTETTQNLVFLGTQIKDKEWIKIQMKKNNEDIQRIDMFAYDNYQGVSLINSNNEGTINRLLIVEKKNEIISSYEEHEKSIIQISNLSEGQSLFYILYSQNSEVGDIEKLFNYIVKNVIDLEKEPEISADEQPVNQDDGEEESDPNDLEKLSKSKKQGEGEENEGEGEEQEKKEQEVPEEENHQEVPEEDCPGGEEDDTVKNKVDVDSTTQLPPQEDPKNVKIQTTDAQPEETVEIVEESEEEEIIVPQKTQSVGGKSSLPPKKNQDGDENSEPEPPSEEYQNCAGEELDTVKNKRDLNANLESKQERVFQAKQVNINETVHEEEGEGDGNTDGQGTTQGEGKTDATDEKTDATDGKTDVTNGKADTDGKTDATDGKTDDTDGKTDATNEKTDATDEKKDATDGKTDVTNGKADTDGKTDATDGKTNDTDGKTDAADATDGKTDATDATNGKTDATDATDGKTDATDGKTDVTDGKTDATDGKIDATNEKTDATDEKKDATDGKTDVTNGKADTDGKTDATDGKTDDTDGKTDATNEKTDATDEKKDATDGKTDATDEKKDATNEKTDATDEKKDATDGKTDATDVKTDTTYGKTDATNEKTDATDATDGKTDATDGKTDVTDGKTDATDGKIDAGDSDQGKTGSNGHTNGENHTDDQTKIKSEKQDNKQELEEPCVILYSECHFTGDELKLCGTHPVIPNDMKNFKVKSIKVPEGVQVTFFNKPNFDDEKLHAKNEMECLETPLRLNLLELMNNLRMPKHVNINSISVTN